MPYLLLLVSLLVIGFTSLVSVPGSPFLINGMTQADISNMFPSAITPAGITFSIWSLIYLSWIVAGIYVAFFEKKKTEKRTLIAFSSAILLTGFWLIPWGNLWIGTSLIVMLVLLGVLKYTFHRTRQAHVLVRGSVELTLGWINIATIANVTVWLLSIGYTGGGIPDRYWAIGILGIAMILTMWYQLKYRAYLISLVFIWAMFGEWLAHPAIEQRLAVIVYASVIGFMMLIKFLKKK